MTSSSFGTSNRLPQEGQKSRGPTLSGMRSVDEEDAVALRDIAAWFFDPVVVCRLLVRILAMRTSLVSRSKIDIEISV